MKIRYAHNGQYPQFVVTAVSQEDQAIMQSFLSHQRNPDLVFWIHGSGGTTGTDEIPWLKQSFNFGWIKKQRGPIARFLDWVKR